MKIEQTTETPIFVPKQEGQVELSLDESISLIIKAQAERKAIDKKLDNLKAVAKAHLKTMGVTKYETPTGNKAAWSERQQPSYDKAAIKEIAGELFELCVSYSTVKQFKVS